MNRFPTFTKFDSYMGAQVQLSFGGNILFILLKSYLMLIGIFVVEIRIIFNVLNMQIFY